jgi:F0F1-type ATP synthase membrane subunit b/b'
MNSAAAASTQPSTSLITPAITSTTPANSPGATPIASPIPSAARSPDAATPDNYLIPIPAKDLYGMYSRVNRDESWLTALTYTVPIVVTIFFALMSFVASYYIGSKVKDVKDMAVAANQDIEQKVRQNQSDLQTQADKAHKDLYQQLADHRKTVQDLVAQVQRDLSQLIDAERDRSEVGRNDLRKEVQDRLNGFQQYIEQAKRDLNEKLDKDLQSTLRQSKEALTQAIAESEKVRQEIKDETSKLNTDVEWKLQEEIALSRYDASYLHWKLHNFE